MTSLISGAHDIPTGIRALLAVDGSNHSLKATEFLAGILPDKSHVRLLRVVGYEFNPDTPRGPLAEAQQRLSRDSNGELATFDLPARICEEAGAEVSSVHRYGHPAEEILLEAAEWGANVIVVGHHDGPARWFFGSVAEALVKNSPLPLVVVP